MARLRAPYEEHGLEHAPYLKFGEVGPEGKEGKTGPAGPEGKEGKANPTATGVTLTEATYKAPTATVSNWAPTANFMDVESALGFSLTGAVAGVEGQLLFIRVKSKYCNVKHESTESTAANRFFLTNGENYELKEGGIIAFIYDATLARWCNYPTPVPGAESIVAAAIKKEVLLPVKSKLAVDPALPAAPGEGIVKLDAEATFAAWRRAVFAGNGVATSFVLTHNLTTKIPLITIYKLATNEEGAFVYIGAEVIPPSATIKVKVLGAKEIELVFTIAPSTTEAYAVAIGGLG